MKEDKEHAQMIAEAVERLNAAIVAASRGGLETRLECEDVPAYGNMAPMHTVKFTVSRAVRRG